MKVLLSCALALAAGADLYLILDTPFSGSVIGVPEACLVLGGACYSIDDEAPRRTVCDPNVQQCSSTPKDLKSGTSKLNDIKTKCDTANACEYQPLGTFSCGWST